jgi:hypothetical protein
LNGSRRQGGDHPPDLCSLSRQRSQLRRERVQRRFPLHQPYDDALDKPTYFERCRTNSDWIERHELERIFVEGDAAFVTYRCVAKGGRTFRNTEFFGFEGDKVKRIDVYFGAAYENGVFVKQPSA